MKGFFTPEELPELTRGPIKQSSCGACGLYKKGKHPKLEVSGEGRKGILLLGEAPGKDEDEAGEFWVGPEAVYLQRHLRNHHVDIDRDCWKLHALACRPLEGRAPKGAEVEACRERVWATIKRLQPRLILLFGSAAVSSFVGDRWHKDKLDGIRRWRGWTIPDRRARAWACPLYAPDFVMEAKDAKKGRTLCVEQVFRDDLNRAMGRLQAAFPSPDLFREEEFVRVIRDETALNGELVRLLRRLEDRPETLAAIDIETTGLKPYREGHRILSCAISVGPDEAFAFPWPEGPHPRARLQRLLARPQVRKVAANLPFEDRWFTHFGLPVQGWYWDTLLASHVLDNRPGITSLKFQSYVQFGVLGYDDEVGPWLKATAEEEKAHGANAYNRAAEYFSREPDKLLLYNGMDALMEHRLALYQMGEMG